MHKNKPIFQSQKKEHEMTTKHITTGLMKGNVVAICLHSGDCPIGMVRTIRRNSVQLELIDWLVGMFDGMYRDIPFADIARIETAPYSIDAHGRKTHDVECLAVVQKEWRAQHESS